MSQTKAQLIEGSAASELTAAKTLLGAGSAGAPSLTATGDTNTGIFFPTADTIAFAEGGVETVRIDSSGRVGIGTNNPQRLLHLASAGATYIRVEDTANTVRNEIFSASSGGWVGTQTNHSLNFQTNNTERARIDTSGRLLVGTSTAESATIGGLLQVQSTGSSAALLIKRNSANTNAPYIYLAKSRGANNATTIVASGDSLGELRFAGADGSTEVGSLAALIKAEVDGTPGANDMPGRLVFSTTADGASTPTERMRITASGDVTTSGTSTFSRVNAGFTARSGDSVTITRSAGTPLEINRQGSDGTLVIFYESNVSEGNISVSGSTVSYNGAHLSRWSQLPGGQEREEILRGSVLSNIDEMCEWGDEENEQLNRMKVSDVEGDKNVSGVFQAWDDDDDTYTNDFYCAMTGDFIIRIGDGVTVERGDLLMSAGDGTAKPQGDGYVQDKTIAKVTSTNVSCTYDDGSYCVPCVLMAC
jgi:hypothetical protein